MRPFKYTRATEPNGAAAAVAANPQAKFLAGGPNILDLMKEDVERPNELVDLTRLKLAEIRAAGDGVSIGALATNTDTANHPLIRQNYPLLTQAIVAGASGQLRNMATNGGNLLQRTRCQYFYDTATPCNKREPGSGCGAREGLNRMHAILGWSDHCVATYPGDMANALLALDALVRIKGADGAERTMPLSEFHRLPGDRLRPARGSRPGDRPGAPGPAPAPGTRPDGGGGRPGPGGGGHGDLPSGEGLRRRRRGRRRRPGTRLFSRLDPAAGAAPQPSRHGVGGDGRRPGGRRGRNGSRLPTRAALPVRLCDR